MIPKERSYVIELTGYKKAATDQITVLADEQTIAAEISYEEQKMAVVVKVPSISVEKEITIRLAMTFRQEENPIEKKCFDFLNQAEIEFVLKDKIIALIQNEHRVPILVSGLQSMGLEEKLLSVLVEFITANLSRN